MNCKQAQERLLECEDPRRATQSPDLAEHLRACDSCQRLVRKLVRLEQAVWELPQPAGVEAAQAKFLRRLNEPRAARPAATTTVRLNPRPRSRTLPLPLRTWAAVAAAIIVAVGLGMVVWNKMHGDGPSGFDIADESQPPIRTPTPDELFEPDSPELLDRLIAWTLTLSAASPANRGRVYSEQAESLRAALNEEDVPESDKALAEELLETGVLLAKNDDPIVDADLLDEVADKLVLRVDTAVADADPEAVERFGKRISRVAEQGINPKLARAEAAGVVKPENQQRLNKIDRRSDARAQALARMLPRAPEKSQKHIKRAMDATHKHAKGKEANKAKKQNEKRK